MQELDDEELDGLESAADVYYRAIGNLIKQGLKESDDARLLGWEDSEPPAAVHQRNVSTAWKLLSAIAYTMTGKMTGRNPRDCYRALLGEDPDYEF